MSHKHENLIRAIFQDPISGNIHWREIESLLHHLGASVEPIQGARYRVVLNGIEGILHHPASQQCVRQTGHQEPAPVPGLRPGDALPL